MWEALRLRFILDDISLSLIKIDSPGWKYSTMDVKHEISVPETPTALHTDSVSLKPAVTFVIEKLFFLVDDK